MTSVTEQLQTAVVLYESGQLEPARQAFVQVLRQAPENATAWHRLGMLMYQAGQVDVARDCVEKAVTFGGQTSDACCHLGLIHRAAGRANDAEHWLRKALELDPAHLDSLNNLGVILLEADQSEEAASLFRRVLECRAEDSTARANLGNALQKQHKLAEAEAEYRAVTGRDDTFAQAWRGLADVLIDSGKIPPAVDALIRLTAIEPGNAGVTSKLIYRSLFLPDITVQRMAELYAEWDCRHAQPLQSEIVPAQNSANADRRLRLGIVSANFRTHAAMHLTICAFENLDSTQLETVFYSDHPADQQSDDVDPMRRRVRNIADHWQDVFSLSDAELAARIRADEIDILLVMSGHTLGNRQLVAARRPAPVQIAWTGDPSGQRAVDYLIADRFLIPEDFDSYYTETIIRMPNDYVTFDLPDSAPEPGPVPVTVNGCVTFGSFNQAVKYHPELMETWARILQRVPQSRLLLGGKGVLEGSGPLLKQFDDAGVSSDRIELRGMVPRAEVLGSYQQIDVALDPFPFSGGITTLEALLMGVPVVTLPGETFAGRTSLTHMENVGQGDLVARTPDEYVDLAVQLAADTTRLTQLRGQLRNDLLQSPICNGEQFGRDLTAALRSAWRRWCESR